MRGPKITPDIIPLYVEAQNAGLVLTRRDDYVLFESFEAAIPNEDVMTCENRLICTYPGPSIQVPIEVAEDEDFQVQLAIFLEQMDVSSLPDAQVKTSKGGTKHTETRDPPSPMYITDFLSSILLGFSNVHERGRFTKRIRDEINWKNAELPWRRSPLWLVARVFLQNSLLSPGDAPDCHLEYKMFMLHTFSTLANVALDANFGLESEFLFFLNNKLARRAYKLGDRPETSDVIKKALETSNRVRDELSRRWLDVQRASVRKIHWEPSTLNFRVDTTLSLLNSREYIESRINHRPEKTSPTIVLPQRRARILDERDGTGWRDIPTRYFKASESATRFERCLALYDFEHWVETSLKSWLDRARGDLEPGTRQLHDAIHDYATSARDIYTGDPERNSIMVLTICELWQALDELACVQFPILKDYSPEIPLKLFEPLVLPRKTQMLRLHSFEQYLKTRHDLAGRSHRSLFSSQVDRTSFSVRTFDDSADMKDTRAEIIVLAEQAKLRKNRELQGCFDRIRELNKQLSDHRYCECRWYGRWTSTCTKCSLLELIQDITISKFEWPLPDRELDCKAAVFELRLPPVFRCWRDATYSLLTKHFSPIRLVSTDERFYTFTDYSILSSFMLEPGRVISWGSGAKPVANSHYSTIRPVSLFTREDEVCVPHALHYVLHDCRTPCDIWTSTISINCCLRALVVPPIPTGGPYHTIRDWAVGVTHTQNEVISKQSECPQSLDIHEFIAFGTLRSGERTQWANILLELEQSYLTHSAEEVHMLFRQAASQCGARDPQNFLRQAHRDLSCEQFCITLLSVVSRRLEIIAENWQQRYCLLTLSHLVQRMLSIASSHREIRDQALDTLQKMLSIGRGWVRRLLESMDQSKTDAEAQNLQDRVFEIALITRLCFDVERHHIPDLLSNREGLSCLILAHSVIFDYAPPSMDDVGGLLRALVTANTRLSGQLEVSIRAQIDGCPDAISPGIELIWAGIPTGANWSCLKGLKDRWVEFTEEENGTARHAHFNIMTGQLLVDGYPVGHLPRGYIEHKTYRRLFGRVIEAFPSGDEAGAFESKHRIQGAKLKFLMKSGDLIIQAHQESRYEELIPHDKLLGDLPNNKVTEYFHWMNPVTHSIEFRPLTSPWTSPDVAWVLNVDESVLSDGTEMVLDMRSKTVGDLEAIFRSFDDRLNISVTLRGNCLEIDLFRYGMRFAIADRGEIESRNFPGMIIDRSSQEVGTLIGLTSLLVLQSDTARLIVVPKGKAFAAAKGHHTTVTINVGANERHVSFYHYTLDAFLGRFEDRAFSESWLFRILLHALTSHCLEDPFTHRTGVEFALSHLQSASAYSFKELAESEIQVLERLASLAPRRSWYPHHLRKMQTVEWNSDLGFLPQDDSFLTSVMKLVEYDNERSFLLSRPDSILSRFPIDAQSTLFCRARIPFRKLRRLDSFKPKEPVRDCNHEGSRHFFFASKFQNRVTDLSSRIYRRDTCEYVESDLMKVFLAWGRLKAPEAEFSIDFDTRWLDANLADWWLTIATSIRGCTSTFPALFMLSTIAVNQDPQARGLLLSLYACSPHGNARPVHLPPVQEPLYNLYDGFSPTTTRTRAAAEQHAIPFCDSEEARVPKHWNADAQEHRENCQKKFRESLKRDIDRIVAFYLAQGANIGTRLARPQLHLCSRVDQDNLHKSIQAYFDSCANNHQLQQYAASLSHHLSELKSQVSLTAFSRIPTFPHPSPSNLPHTSKPPRNLAELFSSRHRFIPKGSRMSEDLQLQRALQEVKEAIIQSHSTFRYDYVQDMTDSLQAFNQSGLTNTAPLTISDIGPNAEVARRDLQTQISSLADALKPHIDLDKLAQNAGIWPVSDMWFWLRKLNSTESSVIGGDWSSSILRLGRVIASCRRLERIKRLSELRRESDVKRELQNISETGWKAEEHPDWLLFEIENDLTIRENQAEIAAEMIDPEIGDNSVTQLNMGEGKSSVITPLVVSAVADGGRLARVVVLKPLNTAMFQILAERLASLCNRRVFFLPFSRSVKVDKQSVSRLRKLFEICRKERGVIVSSPEHILSFNLMGLDYFCRGEEAVSRPLLDLQDWLRLNVRDILDESDELLSVKYQLVYTVGLQQPVDGQPDRWVIIQEVLSILRKSLDGLEATCGEDLSVSSEPAHIFPLVRLLQGAASECESSLADTLVGVIERDGLLSLSFRLFPEEQRSLVKGFIKDPDFPPDQEEKLSVFLEGAKFSAAALLLLRGLFAHRLLVFSLRQKRWRVDYGMDLNSPPRTLLAIPYRAKDKPDQRASFGHPDVALLLTCLSYYYAGLTEDQLKYCFLIILKCEDPSTVYGTWIRDIRPPLPISLRSFGGVNVLDESTWRCHIYPAMRRCKVVIDFYLSHHVFPREAKEFPHKLTTNSWDLAERKAHPTTGFSGTNDNRHLLPLSISQQDSMNQRHTNALVLRNILRPENDQVILSEESNAAAILSAVLAQLPPVPPVHVILDVGAQVLELANKDMASAWLEREKSPAIKAAIYFDDNDEAMVLMRNGTSEKLKGSSMLKQMDACLAYLDEAHTRGTDLPFPIGTRALVTLGPRLVKDKLAQGCMRMRKLGHGHSLVFFCPPEIQGQIRHTNPSGRLDIHVKDILRWCMLETCTLMEANAALWAQQGYNFLNRRSAWSRHRNDENSDAATALTALIDSLREPEARTLQQLYSPRREQKSAPREYSEKWMTEFAGQIQEKCRQLGVSSLEHASQQEEQEREVAEEEEQERNEERPPPAKPASHSIHQAVRDFIGYGIRPRDFTSAFSVYSESSFSNALVRGWSNRIFCTPDFVRVVQKASSSKSSQNDLFLRPVNWILSSKDYDYALVLSPFEVNELLPDIQRSAHTRLALYRPRTVQSTAHDFEALTCYTVPRLSAETPLPPLTFLNELNLMAGQLYFRDEATYRSLCDYLGVNNCDNLAEVDGGAEVNPETGFVGPLSRIKLGMSPDSPFVEDPIPLIRHIATARRKGKPFYDTHLGKLVRGRILSSNDF